MVVVQAAAGRLADGAAVLRGDLRRAIAAAGRRGGGRTDREHPEQSAVVSIMRANGVVFNAQSNGLRLSKSQAIKAVKDGLQAGCPDLIIFTPPSRSLLGDLSDEELDIVDRLRGLEPETAAKILRCAGLGPGVALEMKTADAKPKTSRAHKHSGARPNQKAWLATLEALGWTCFVGYGALDALEKLRSIGVVR